MNPTVVIIISGVGSRFIIKVIEAIHIITDSVIFVVKTFVKANPLAEEELIYEILEKSKHAVVFIKILLGKTGFAVLEIIVFSFFICF